MKVSEEDKKSLKALEGDPEAYHGLYDALLVARLHQLDPEYMEDMEEISKDCTFWYA